MMTLQEQASELASRLRAEATAMRAAAEGMTPGPWIVDPTDPAVVLAPCPCCGPIATCAQYGPGKDRNNFNTTHIARQSPDRVEDHAGLLEAYATMIETVAAMAADHDPNCCDWTIPEIGCGCGADEANAGILSIIQAATTALAPFGGKP